MIRTRSALRQRMVEDMRMRKLEPKTQEAHIRAVRKLAAFLDRSPDTATVEELRNFQLDLVDSGVSPITLNATLTGLKFFFDVTLGRIELMARMQPVKVPRTLPVVLSPEEVARLIAAAANLKHQVALSVAYGAGLRASEVISLKVTDVDSQRMALRVEQGKGAKDRYAMLSPVLLQRLRTWWRVAHAPGQDAPRRMAVPGPGAHVSDDGPATRPRRSRRGPGRRARQARDPAHAAPQLCHPPARAQDRHPRDPGAARPQEAGLWPEAAYVPSYRHSPSCGRPRYRTLA
jgi:integrase